MKFARIKTARTLQATFVPPPKGEILKPKELRDRIAGEHRDAAKVYG